MTRDSALIQLDKGKKITHRSFTPYEFLSKDKGKITTEDGYPFGKQFNEKDYFHDGWSIYNNQKKDMFEAWPELKNKH